MTRILTSSTLLFPLRLVVAGACTSMPAGEELAPLEPGGKADHLLGSSEQPALECWDWTYAYNRLRIEDLGDQLRIDLSGANLRIAELAPNAEGWNSAWATVTLSVDDCMFSPTNGLLMYCNGSDVPVEVRTGYATNEVTQVSVLDYFHIATVHRVTTEATGNTFEEIVMTVTTNKDQSWGTYEIPFPVAGCE